MALPWASDELRLIRWLGAGVASIALIIIVVSVWTGFGGNTLEIVHGIALVVGALTAAPAWRRPSQRITGFPRFAMCHAPCGRLDPCPRQGSTSPPFW